MLTIETPEQLEKYLLLETYSDVYKDVTGFRPRGQGLNMETPIDEIEAALNRLTGVEAEPTIEPH